MGGGTFAVKVSVVEFYRQVLELTDGELLQKLLSVTEIHCLSKRDIFIREGQPLNYISFVVSGIFREWILDANGRDITDCFSFRYGEPVMPAFDLNAACAMVTIEALTDGEFLCIPIDEVRNLMREDIRFVHIYNRLLARAMERHWEVKNILHKQTASERYQWFLLSYPGLIDKVTHRYIASFLEMSPVTLSRLRSTTDRKAESSDENNE